MSHYITFSITGTHIKNAEREINLMHNVKSLKKCNLDYGIIEYNVFRENLSHGILAIYSLNAALESIVAMLNTNLNLGESKFYNRTEVLKNRNIISDLVSYGKCIELREKRNIITHWEKDGYQLLGSAGYLPFMFENIIPQKDDEKLISILTRESLGKYYNDFCNLLENICTSHDVKNNFQLQKKLDYAKAGIVEFE